MTRVQDIMQRDVLTISPEASISELIRQLEDAGISGMPVVDGDGILLGVASSRDIVRLAADMEKAPEAMRWGIGVTPSGAQDLYLETPEEGEFYAYYVTPGGGFVDVRDRIRELPNHVFQGYTVRDLMTSVPFTIGPTATLGELAHLLRSRRVHRALVMEDGQLVGIVTTMDVLRAIETR